MAPSTATHAGQAAGRDAAASTRQAHTQQGNTRVALMCSLLDVRAALQEEFAATRSRLLMYRRFMHDLVATVAGRSRPQLFLDGPPGAFAAVSRVILQSLPALDGPAGSLAARSQ